MRSTAVRGPTHRLAARHWRLRLFAGLAMLLLLLAPGCYNSKTGATNIGGAINFKLPVFPETGLHAVEILTEMHYQPSYREGEIPRLLPPEGSVPITGAEVIPASAEEYSALEVPSEVVRNYDPAKTQRLYTVNCQVCHGASLQGDGPILPYMTRGPFPANLKDPVTVQSTDGDLFGFISVGGRQGLAAISRGQVSRSPMPPFNKLLTEDDRWALVWFLRSHIGR